ncbi:MAG: acyl-CoA thioesterase [Pseudomonadota bacterium]
MNEAFSFGSEPVIRTVMMPRDTNMHGTIFGGVILSHIDQAAGAVAHARARGPVVTLKVEEVIFRAPVMVGDLLSVYAQVENVGRTSIRVSVQVYATRPETGARTHVTSAQLTFVAVGPDRRPIPIPE